MGRTIDGFRLFLVVVAAGSLAGPLRALALPPGFVYADEAIPSLRTDVRYASSQNFLGRPVAGYVAPRVILTHAAAEALARIQKRLEPFGLGLKIYDGYRPQRAVDDFVRWSRDPADQKGRAEFYPDLDKSEILPKGYLSTRSGHSRGSTVDLTIVSLAGGPDAELDMGGTFDWFGPRSSPSFAGITPQQRANRLLLRTVLVDGGFAPIELEWWHFTLRGEPYPSTSFDFAVE